MAGALRVRLSEVLQYDVRVELEHVLPSCEKSGGSPPNSLIRELFREEALSDRRSVFNRINPCWPSLAS